MKLAIDSYSYHRYFGEVYPGLEADPGSRITMEAFIDRAKALGVAGVSLESCFLPDPSADEVERLRNQLDRLELERVWAWGHPGGLRSGDAPEELADLKRHTGIAAAVGAKVMRICCGGRRTRPQDWREHKARLVPLLVEAARHAKTQGIVLAIENHIDLLADELVELIETVDSPWLGICLDTANNLRMLEDPAVAIEKLAPYARATHVKDVTARSGNPREFAFWPSVPVGRGIIDIPHAFNELRKHGYNGLLALEIDYLHPDYTDDEQAIVESIEYMRGLL
ncbi:sugar phosphate isomerase/epimerase family protein [Paraburkholderia susongensis]|uniref:Sugar phosphate isomerase/epimerase n=1 Tax=Paraburkholderia susongensis TaxID=1515439 RepID=A0A1X7LSD0_9BURK|nr:sugar phosphate isomerase/epimerase family protein [Paraburkholderia susongensis]SMG56039.1 Sugar phosphate isomerase/epimerase [Paraburkholderia susongensis]